MKTDLTDSEIKLREDYLHTIRLQWEQGFDYGFSNTHLPPELANEHRYVGWAAGYNSFKERNLKQYNFTINNSEDVRQSKISITLYASSLKDARRQLDKRFGENISWDMVLDNVNEP